MYILTLPVPAGLVGPPFTSTLKERWNTFLGDSSELDLAERSWVKIKLLFPFDYPESVQPTMCGVFGMDTEDVEWSDNEKAIVSEKADTFVEILRDVYDR